jgi:hypothetical protein
MMAERLPTILHGVCTSEDDKRIVEDALQDVIARLNVVPSHLSLRVICSVLVSVCCAQDDPASTYAMIGGNAGRAIKMAIEEPEGNG